MSALPPKADIAQRERHVRFGPKADIGRSPHPADPQWLLSKPFGWNRMANGSI
jgi:hypothetical protein